MAENSKIDWTDKVCRDCRLAKPLDEFARNATGTFGRGSYCKPCQKIRRKRHYDLNRDRAVELARRQRERLKAEPPHLEFPPNMTKTCRGCGLDKALDAFTPHDRGLYGRYSLCRLCAAERAHAWREKDVEHARELHRAAERARERSGCERPGCENRVGEGARRFCSIACRDAVLHGSLEQRFWAKVDRSGVCWVWTAHQVTSGYGAIQIAGRPVLAHRLAYEWLVGPIPEGTELDHLCRNRACVRPEHLEPVSHQVNVLRGQGIAAQRARELSCKNGHPKLAENLYAAPDGGRECRICRDARSRAHYLARKERG